MVFAKVVFEVRCVLTLEMLADRARLQNFVAALSDDKVQAASQKAFAALPNVKEAVSQLSVLKGIGPATASAVLATHAPTVAPFMSDEAMVAALGSVKGYTLKSYLVFAEKLRNKAECILLIQDHAVEVVKYCTVFQVCQRYCKTNWNHNCIPDEHYLQTL